MIQNDDLLWDDHEEDHVSQSLRVFQCYQQTLGLGFKVNEQKVPIPDYDIGLTRPADEVIDWIAKAKENRTPKVEDKIEEKNDDHEIA